MAVLGDSLAQGGPKYCRPAKQEDQAKCRRPLDGLLEYRLVVASENLVQWVTLELKALIELRGVMV